MSNDPGAPIVSFIAGRPPGRTAGLTELERTARAQTHGGWEIIIVADERESGTAPAAGVHRPVGETGLSYEAALGDAVAAARGRLVSFVGVDDRLDRRAVEVAAATLVRFPEIGLFYTDERDGETGEDILKPAFSPERLRGEPYLGDLTFFSRRQISELGGVDPLAAGVEIYDLALRLVASGAAVAHVPEILFERAGSRNPLGSRVDEAERARNGLTAVRRHLAATGGGSVDEVWPGPVFRSRRAVDGDPLVSIIIPTRGDSAVVQGRERVMVVEAIRSVVTTTDYVNFEIVVVVDTVTPAEVRAQIEEVAGERLRLVEWDRPFSFSAKMNLGVVHSEGEYLLFLNDDVEVISPEWLSSMLALAQLPGAGIAGAVLYFEDDSIQHAGHAYYRSDVTHIGLHSPRGAAGPGGAFNVEREVNGATAACAVMPRDVFFEAGGFSNLLPGNFNDVDLCMKIASLGYRAYVTPFAELYHYESKSRNPRVHLSEIQLTWGRWGRGFWDSAFWPYDPHLVSPVADRTPIFPANGNAV